MWLRHEVSASAQKSWPNEMTQVYLGFSNLMIVMHSTSWHLLIEVICIIFLAWMPALSWTCSALKTGISTSLRTHLNCSFYFRYAVLKSETDFIKLTSKIIQEILKNPAHRIRFGVKLVRRFNHLLNKKNIQSKGRLFVH